jgi:ATP synthase subunit 6
MTLSVFDQFEITRIIPIHPFGNLDLSITNSTLFMVVAYIFIVQFYNANIKWGKLIPNRWQSILELIYSGIAGIVKENIGPKEYAKLPLLFTLFMFIGTMNLFGLVPYTFTPTAHIVITFGLSLSIFLACNIIALTAHKWNFFSMFLPAGSPIVLAPFLILIEIISHFAKAISLGVRLASNITAGHLLFVILSGFTWQMFISGSLSLLILSIFPFIIIFLITGLELAVAIIQAYVFSLLTAIYLNDSIHLH